MTDETKQKILADLLGGGKVSIGQLIVENHGEVNLVKQTDTEERPQTKQDKDIRKLANKHGDTIVQGDLVMEKNVEYEVGHVAAGGTGISVEKDNEKR